VPRNLAAMGGFIEVMVCGCVGYRSLRSSDRIGIQLFGLTNRELQGRESK
jgi:hypothetical protein